MLDKTSLSCFPSKFSETFFTVAISLKASPEEKIKAVIGKLNSK